MANAPDQDEARDPRYAELARLGKRIEDLNAQIATASGPEREALEAQLSEANAEQEALVKALCESDKKPPDKFPELPPDPCLGVRPPAVCRSIGRGGSADVEKKVRTPRVPPNSPDIVFLADTTASMAGEIEDVKARVRSVVGAVKRAQPSAQFGVAQYKDAQPKDEHPFVFNVDQTITDDVDAIEAAVNAWQITAGYTTAEGQLRALHDLAGAAGWRPDSKHIVVWFGDAPAHDPIDGISLDDAISALTDANVCVLAISTGRDQLDDELDEAQGGPTEGGQATQITDRTGGALYRGIAADEVSEQIRAAIEQAPVTVTPRVEGCDDGLSITFTPPSQRVASGDDAIFTEIITVALDAPQDAILTCLGGVHFDIDGQDQGAKFTQTVVVSVREPCPDDDPAEDEPPDDEPQPTPASDE